MLLITAAKRIIFGLKWDIQMCTSILQIFSLHPSHVFRKMKSKIKQTWMRQGSVQTDRAVSSHFSLLCLADRESSADSLILPAEWTNQPYWGHIWQPFSCQVFLYSSLTPCWLFYLRFGLLVCQSGAQSWPFVTDLIRFTTTIKYIIQFGRCK